MPIYYNPSIKERITDQNNTFAEYKYSGSIDGKDRYSIFLSDCTMFMVEVSNGRIDKIYHTVNDSCNNTQGLLEDRMESLRDLGFQLKESAYKDGRNILFLDGHPDYFYVVDIVISNSYGNPILGMDYNLYSKQKYPEFDIF